MRAAYLIATLTTPLLRVEAAARRGHAATACLMGETLDGIRYAARHPGLGPILLFAAVSALLLRGVQEILPPFVERAFGRGAESLAVLTAAFGVGALVSGLAVAARGRLEGTTRLAVLGVLGAGAVHRRLRRDRLVPLRRALRGADGRGRVGARHQRADAGAECLRPRHARAGAEPVGADHPRLPGARRADAGRGGGGLGPAPGRRWPRSLLSLLVVAWGHGAAGAHRRRCSKAPPPDHANR